MTYRSESRGFMYAAPPDGNEKDESVDGTAVSEATEEIESEATSPSKDEATNPSKAGTTKPAQTDSAAEPAGHSEQNDMETVELGEASSTTDANWTGTVPADD